MNFISKKDHTATSDSGAKIATKGSKNMPRERRLFAEIELLRIFNHVVAEPVPSEFLELLRRIDDPHPA